MSLSSIDSYQLPQFSPLDTFRDDKIIHLETLISRVCFYIGEFFRGGIFQRDRAAFDQFYQQLSPKIDDLARSQAATQKIIDLLKMDGSIQNSLFGRHLASLPSYQKFREKLEQLRTRALTLPTSQEEKRWLSADVIERRIALLFNMKTPPLRYREIPRGSIILTNPETYLCKQTLQAARWNWQDLILKIKSLIYRFLAGEKYTHAALVLKNGIIFDLDQMNFSTYPNTTEVLTSSRYAIGTIKEYKQDKPCFFDVLEPNREKMVSAYNDHHPNSPVDSFEAFWDKVEEKIREDHPKVRCNILDLIKVVFTRTRPAHYDPSLCWNPEKRQYTCSATISSLYSFFGVDVGQSLNKKNESILPSDFLRSEFFLPLQMIK